MRERWAFCTPSPERWLCALFLNLSFIMCLGELTKISLKDRLIL